MKRILLAALVLMAVVGVDGASAQTIAEVGGVAITQQQVLAADPAAAKDPKIRNTVLVALINRQAILNEVQRSGVDKSAAYKAAIAVAVQNAALNFMAQQYLSAHPVTDQDVQAAYNVIFDKPLPTEYRLRQITVTSFDAAQTVISELKNGQEFSSLAAQQSIDASGAVGGEVGWEADVQLAAPILIAVKKLKIGDVAGPISVPDGYVIIQLLGERTAPKPPISAVKDQLKLNLEQQKWTNEVVALRTAQKAQLVMPLSNAAP